ncbi:MAG: MBL fold metallo-hydrolase [Anaerolineae bacterium]|nr:MBL fold metallo-hydrolase [Anaerolineae bacterium]
MKSSLLPKIDIHYVGHSSFILKFDNGITILTDYGQSNAYGLDSPIYELDHFQPNITTYSHHHVDHDRGRVFEGTKVISGKNLEIEGITLTSIPVTENSEGDNYGYLIDYKGCKIYHSGDSQGDIVRIEEEEIRQRLEQQLPDRIDLLLVAIGWTKDIISHAEAYVDFLHPLRVIPMHYWAESEKAGFFTYLKGRGKKYHITEIGGSRYILNAFPSHQSIEVISLTAGPYKG